MAAATDGLSRLRVGGGGWGRSGGPHGLGRPLEAMFEGDIACGEIDQAPGNEEGAHPARALLGQKQRGLLDALEPADARADQDAGADLVLIGRRFPTAACPRLGGGAPGGDDELAAL